MDQLSFDFPSRLNPSLQVPVSLIPAMPVAPAPPIIVDYSASVPTAAPSLKKKTLSELRSLCREAGLKTDGSKSELLARLNAAEIN